MEIQQLYQLYKQTYKVETDTRKDLKEAIFFALKGENFNGNRFAAKALEAGARYAVVDEEAYATDDRIILVEDVLATLQKLARFHREQLGITVMALTGSNGKTTTKELIFHVLKQKFKCTATRGNLNNHIGVPLTLLSVKPGIEMAVVEMGANHPGEIDMLCNIALPDYGFITNFGKVHLEGFGSLDGVIEAKTEMYRHLKKHGKTVFVNGFDPVQLKRSENMRRIVINSPDADFPVAFIKADPFVTVKFGKVEVQSKLIGKYNYANIAAAISIGTYFKVDKLAVKQAIESYIPQNNRSQIITKASNRIILDAYNANPESMKAALENLSQLSDANKVAILGDMFEIGAAEMDEHQRIADLLAGMDVQQVFLIGKIFAKVKSASSRIKKFGTFDAFKESGFTDDIKNATVLIKASRGMRLERVLDLF